MILNDQLTAKGIVNGHSLVNEAAQFTKPLEGGLITTPKWDYQQWTWGYGTAAGYDPNKKPTGTITETKAFNDLLNHVEDSLTKITKYLTVTPTRNQLIALASFYFNIGFGSATKAGTKNILDRMNAGMDKNGVAAAMKLYNKAGGKVNANLVQRREIEANKFLS